MAKQIPVELMQALRYERATGLLYWRVKPARWMRDGQLAGTVRDDGYVMVSWHNVLYCAHRIIWRMHNAVLPGDVEIDHRDLDPSNNRYENLRLADHSRNMTNTPRRKHNRSGVKGVSWDKARWLWTAEIRKDNKKHFLGRFGDIEDARAAYVSASVLLHGDFGRMN